MHIQVRLTVFVILYLALLSRIFILRMASRFLQSPQYRFCT